MNIKSITAVLAGVVLALVVGHQASAQTFSKPVNDQVRIVKAAMEFGISTRVIEYVAKRESTFQCSPRHPPYNGPLQISMKSARALGFTGSKSELDSCGAGLTYGLRHLKLCYDKIGDFPVKVAACHASPASYNVIVAWRDQMVRKAVDTALSAAPMTIDAILDNIQSR